MHGNPGRAKARSHHRNEWPVCNSMEVNNFPGNILDNLWRYLIDDPPMRFRAFFIFYFSLRCWVFFLIGKPPQEALLEIIVVLFDVARNIGVPVGINSFKIVHRDTLILKLSSPFF